MTTKFTSLTPDEVESLYTLVGVTGSFDVKNLDDGAVSNSTEENGCDGVEVIFTPEECFSYGSIDIDTSVYEGSSFYEDIEPVNEYIANKFVKLKYEEESDMALTYVADITLRGVDCLVEFDTEVVKDEVVKDAYDKFDGLTFTLYVNPTKEKRKEVITRQVVNLLDRSSGYSDYFDHYEAQYALAIASGNAIDTGPIINEWLPYMMSTGSTFIATLLRHAVSGGLDDMKVRMPSVDAIHYSVTLNGDKEDSIYFTKDGESILVTNGGTRGAMPFFGSLITRQQIESLFLVIEQGVANGSLPLSGELPPKYFKPESDLKKSLDKPVNR